MTNPTGSILLRRGPTTDRVAFCPLSGEIIYDSDEKKVFVGDGQLYGGESVINPYFPDPGVMIKGNSHDIFSTQAGSTSGAAAAIQFLSYDKATGAYSFRSLSASGPSVTTLIFTGADGISITRTDVLPTVTNPTITDVGYLTFGVNAATLKTAMNLNNVTNESKATMFSSPSFSGTATATTFSGNLTGNVTGTVSGNAGTVTNGFYTTSSFNLGTSSIAINRASALQTLTGISIDGNAGTVTNGFYTSSSFNLGTTSIAINRASATQTLSGISIDGNAGTVTNGIYSSGSYANPTWITSLDSTKVLPSQSGNTGKVLSTNGSVVGWIDPGSAGFPSVVGNTGKFLSTDGSTVFWAAELGTITSVTGTAPVVSSGGTTPAISMAAATASVNGYMTSTYAGKLDGIATGATANTGTIISVTGTAPVVSSGGTTPAISMAAATTSVSGYLTSTDWTTFNNKQATLAAATASVSGYMTSTYAGKLDGIATGATANTGTITSVTGTAPVVSSGGTTPAISMAAATTSVSGYLTSTDWTTFNGKQSALGTASNFQFNSIGVGTAAAATAGDIRATANITAYYTSDKRLKENVIPISNSLEKIKQINGVNFDWTDEEIQRRGGVDGYFVRKSDVGVIAQEIEKVLPEAVATRESGYLAVRYELLVPLLIEAIKEQQGQIDELKRLLDNR